MPSKPPGEPTGLQLRVNLWAALQDELRCHLFSTSFLGTMNSAAKAALLAQLLPELIEFVGLEKASME